MDQNSVGSEARQVFDVQLSNILDLLRVIVRDIDGLAAPLDSMRQILDAMDTRSIDVRQQLLTDIAALSLHIEKLSLHTGELSLHTEKLISMIRMNTRVHALLFDWALVMMVTYTEAYLEHALLLLTAANPAWLATGGKYRVSGHDVLKIDGEPSLDIRWKLFMEMMNQSWSAEFLQGKPGSWISKLTKIGATGYRDGLVEEMTTIWNRRHTIVHARPAALMEKVTGANDVAEYVRSRDIFHRAVTAIFDFVEPTDTFVVNSLGAKPSGTA